MQYQVSSNNCNTLQDETCGSTVDRSCQSPLECFSLFFTKKCNDHTISDFTYKIGKHLVNLNTLNIIVLYLFGL